MAVYFIDRRNGDDTRDGLSECSARQNYKTLPLEAGDSVLFRRGSVYREKLETVAGVRYAAYGDGDAPLFCVSTDVSDADCWLPTERENIWRCVKEIPGDVGNFIFDENVCAATLRWEKDDLSAQGDFWDNRYTLGARAMPPQEVLLYSVGNPGEVYTHIEAASYAARHCGDIKPGTTFEDLHFKNSGVHALAGQGDGVTVRRCRFENIGGCAWSVPLRIRYGNGVEFWQHGSDILIEDCFFQNVYDSCVTHQGPGEKTVPTRHFICRHNVFDTYGMAAFEYRDKMPIDSAFTHNTCRHAGCGFAMRGETLPRRSEIYPRPMGHHIFLWRIESASEGGSLSIAHNRFGDAPVGAAIYSIISPEAEAQMRMEQNTYQRNDTLLIRFGGTNYADLAAYQSATGQDAGSAY